MEEQTNKFTFEISLSVLNHLGRNLYRSFITVLGEAISNAWDADAENVWIYIDKINDSFVIKDDGYGMTKDDFQNKFLKIGYSKRKESLISPNKKRPYIGRKGIGKLALLSCAEKIHVLSKTNDTNYIGGVIDNTGLDKAITDDLTPGEYSLGEVNQRVFSRYVQDHKKGTIIYFEKMKDGVKNSSEFIRRQIALYFRFSLVDKTFNIFVNDTPITLDELENLAIKTQFFWRLNGLVDPFITEKLLSKATLKNKREINNKGMYRGFIASVDLPNDLKIISADERISVDLFVNGRLREKDILKHIPTARIVENYLYGQIHFDELDGEVDRFTSSREGIVADDLKFKELLDSLREVLAEIIEDWDKWRVDLRKNGDPENTRITKKERSSRDLFNVVSQDFSLPDESPQKRKIDTWVDELANDAQFDFSSYAECFISENLLRKYIAEKGIPFTPKLITDVKQYRTTHENAKQKGNISIDIRENDSDLAYLAMDDLAFMVEKMNSNTQALLTNDASSYKPIRDALMHTSLLTDAAKKYLTAVYENIKSRINKLLSMP